MKIIHIRKILVPVDFSNNCMNALQTAVAIAKRHQAIVHLLYVNDYDYDLFQNDANIIAPRLKDYLKTLAQLAKTVIVNDGVKCTYATEHGGVTHNILKTSINLNIDLIVMGKNGTNGLSKTYAGTHAIQIAEKSRVPVIIIPENVTKHNFENILFPIRPLLSMTDKYDSLRPFILKSKPSITLLNLRNPNYENELHIIHRLSLLMKMKLESDDVPYDLQYYFENNDFAEHVIKVIEESEKKFDLTIVTAEISKSNKDFHISYYTQKIIHHATIPVLIIRPENAKLDKEEVLEKLEKHAALN